MTSQVVILSGIKQMVVKRGVDHYRLSDLYDIHQTAGPEMP